MYESDKRVVLTLDAGGTNFVFSALRSNRQVVAPIPLPAEPDNLDRCLEVLVRGFERVSSQLGERPVAISFAFPGPADYANGIIGDLPNFPAFRVGVALGPYLSRHFGLPVFMENDGNLFALGEALSGALTEVNEALRASGSLRTYRNLLGITLGTGFGAGVVIDGRLLTGDNGCGGDVWLLRNRKYPGLLAEESVSIRAVKRVYAECGGAADENLTPKDIFDIAEGARPGNRDAAIASFRELGTMAGAGITAALNIVDGIVVVGGGLAGAAKYILPGLLGEMRSRLSTFGGASFPALQMEVYDWETPCERLRFLDSDDGTVSVPGTEARVAWCRMKKTAVLCSRLGASQAIMCGAYALALSRLDAENASTSV